MNNCYKTEYYQVVSKKLPKAFDGMRMVFLSDLHGVRIRGSYELLYQCILKNQPELILIGGDMVVGSSSFHDYLGVAGFISRLVDLAPVFYALGNHEHRLLECEKERGKILRYFRYLKAAGVTLMDNRSVYLRKGKERIALTGITLNLKYGTKWWKDTKLDEFEVERMVTKKSEVLFEILLAHIPMHYPLYAQMGYDLVLSGHLHGGVVRFPKLGGVLSPNCTFFPRYDSGMFHELQSTLIVSRGLGEHTIPVRLWNPREISLIELKKI